VTQHYTVTLLKDPERSNNLEAIKAIGADIAPALAERDIGVFGTFAPLFGLASNELYLVTHGDKEHSITAQIESATLAPLDSISLVPTVRPTEHTPRTRPGIYVFRWFDVYNKDIEEIAALSNEAWNTFEGGFDTEVQGLFCEEDTSTEKGKMLLITQYTDLSVWEASRNPAPEARENFLKRARLTIEARPICTRLIL
jgi:hypothetical protein